MEKIKNCPFCNDHYIIFQQGVLDGVYHFRCPYCKIDMIVQAKDSASAINLFNRRAYENEH